MYMTPPPSPPPQIRQASRCPPTPESRVGIFLGSSLELKGILGTGAYGVVYSALDHHSQTWYAVKALSKSTASGEPLDRRQRDFQAREIQLHYAASAHPNVVSMLKIVDDPECTYVVLEYCPEGDLFSNITERGRFVSNDALVRRAFLQILNAVEHCHRLGIYHRDLKPENILVAQSGRQVLLADFGLATTDPESEDHGCGSTFYMSPECLDPASRRAPYRCAPNDIWSLGVVLVNLTCGRNPWKQASIEDSTYTAFMRNRDFLKTILPLSDELNEILCRIFERNPESRIAVSELKQRIAECVHFSAPPPQLLTPPTSPLYPPVDEYESLSDAGSLTDSCSTLSDPESEPGSESASGSGSSGSHDSREGSPGLENSIINNHNNTTTNRDAQQQVQWPAYPSPFVLKQPTYVLISSSSPCQDFQGKAWAQPAKPNPSIPHWCSPYDYGHVHPAPAVHPTYHSHYSHHHQQSLTQVW